MIAYLCAIGIVALIYCLLALGLNLQFGLTRLVNFGVVAFFAVGAYTSGLLALQGVPLVLCFVAAGVLAGVLALPIGLLSLRLRDDYLAIVTLGFSEAVRISIQQESWLTKGVQGLPGLPKLFASWGSGVSDMAIFATLLALVALVAWGTVRLAASPFGRLLKAIGDDEAALSALGKDPAWFKVQVFMLGAVLAGADGGVLRPLHHLHHARAVHPAHHLLCVDGAGDGGLGHGAWRGVWFAAADGVSGGLTLCQRLGAGRV